LSLQLWLARVLRDAVAVQLSGVFCPFKHFAGHHLVTLAAEARASSGGLGPITFTAEEAASKIAAAWANAEPFPDIGPGLEQLQHSGIKIAALTNGSMEIAGTVLKKAGITPDAVYDISETKAWKPAGDSYIFALNTLLLSPQEVMMVAAHPWDCHGALQVGLRACYLQRTVEQYPEFLDQPELTVRTFTELAEALLAPSDDADALE